MHKLKNFEDYVVVYKAETQARLRQIRDIILKVAPDAQELISYGMPAFKLNGPLCYFAAFKNHVGLYALPSGNTAFQKELKNTKP